MGVRSESEKGRGAGVLWISAPSTKLVLSCSVAQRPLPQTQ